MAPSLAPKGFSGLPINVPWGLSIDGNDDVWFGNFYGAWRSADGG